MNDGLRNSVGKTRGKFSQQFSLR